MKTGNPAHTAYTKRKNPNTVEAIKIFEEKDIKTKTKKFM